MQWETWLLELHWGTRENGGGSKKVTVTAQMTRTGAPCQHELEEAIARVQLGSLTRGMH